MPLYDVFLAAQPHEVLPDVSSATIARYPELKRAAPIIAMMLASGSWAFTAQPKFTWQSVDLRARTTTVNNGGAAYDGTTTAIVVTDSTVFGVGDVVSCEATDEKLYITAINYGTHTITVRRGLGAAAGGVAAGAGGVANAAVLRNIGPAAPPGGDKLAEVFIADSKRENICQFFRKTVSSDGRLQATQTFTQESLAKQTALRLEELYRDAELAILLGTYSDDALTAANEKITTTQGFVGKANVIAINGNITKALFNQHCRTIFGAGGSQKRVAFCGLEALDYVLDAYSANRARNESDVQVGSVVRSVITNNGLVDLVPHLGLSGARSKDMLLVDMDGAPPKLRHMGVNRFKGNGANLDGKFQILDNRQGTSEDKATRELVADFGLEWGEQSFTHYIKNITGAA